MKNYIKGELRKNLVNENTSEIWYHGSPDVRQLEIDGGFTEKTKSVTYAPDPQAYFDIQKQLNDARGNEDLYWKLIDKVPAFKKEYIMKNPIFLSDKLVVARTYADANRSMDYQNAQEKVVTVEVIPGKTVKIVAIGDRFRFINTDKVRKGFMNAGVPQETFDKTLQMFNFMVKDDKGIKTDSVAAMGQYLGFDTIDVVGVLDSYNGGSVKSTVRMVFNPNNIKLK